MIAAGFGARSGCSAHDVVQALERALAAAGRVRGDVVALYVPEFKRAERGLSVAALELDTPVTYLALAQLQAQATRTLTRSERVLLEHGLPSVAETAALAGAALQLGAAGSPRLLGPRAAVGGATCALAECADSDRESST